MTETTQLAQEVHDGKISSASQLDNRLAQILSAKADGDRQHAVAGWSSKSYKSVGYDLQQAADEVDLASQWSSQKLDAMAQSSMKDVRKVGGDLIEGGKWTAHAVTNAFKDLEKSVRSLAMGTKSDIDETTTSGTTHR